MRVLLSVPVILVLAACTVGPPRTRDYPPVSETTLATYPFAPTTLRVHPLTHVEAAGELPGGGKPDASELVLHFELLDRYGDSVKGLGSLKVQLYRPGEGMSPGMETQELTWDVPGMDNAEQNTRRFDTATRTYRV